ncbi:MAG TPA: hypothetical protein VFA56_12215 [Gaiellaceae bacterium]|nr:hypothetical protein [Gaiellaceae bacterium]
MSAADDLAERRLAAARARVDELERDVQALSRELLELEQENARLRARAHELSERESAARLNGSAPHGLAAHLRRLASGDDTGH